MATCVFGIGFVRSMITPSVGLETRPNDSILQERENVDPCHGPLAATPIVVTCTFSDEKLICRRYWCRH